MFLSLKSNNIEIRKVFVSRTYVSYVSLNKQWIGRGGGNEEVKTGNTFGYIQIVMLAIFMFDSILYFGLAMVTEDSCTPILTLRASY